MSLRRALRALGLVECMVVATIAAIGIANVVFANTAASEVALPTQSLVPGGVFTTAIPGAADLRPSVSLDGIPAMVLREGDHWRAVVGIPLSKETGKAEVLVKLGAG